MTNFEFYKDKITEILKKGSTPMVHNGIPSGSCEECDCSISGTCDLYDTSDCTAALLKWLYEEHIEQPKLTKKERQFCELVETGWICRDSSDELWWFKYRPNKNGSKCWDNGGIMNYISNLPCKFSFIKWEDKEPWSVKELLKLEAEE